MHMFGRVKGNYKCFYNDGDDDAESVINNVIPIF